MDIAHDLKSFSEGKTVSLIDRLIELQHEEHRPLTWKDLFEVTGKDADQFPYDLVNEYLSAFTPMDNGHCISCGASQGGFLGHFEYGLAHGEGRCSKCGYPARADHYIKRDGKDYLKFHTILQYHPSGLSPRKDKP